MNTTAEKKLAVLVVAGTALLIWGLWGALDKGYITLEALEDLVPQIEYKDGVQIQTIDGKRFIRVPKRDGSYYLTPLDTQQ